MSDERENIASESEVAATLEPAVVQRELRTPGEFLRAARELQGLAVERVADDLHLSKSFIEAIEADQYTVLGAPVYAKGHLRRYAVRLNVPVDEVTARYDRLDVRQQSSMTTVKPSEMSRPIDISPATTSFRIAPRSSSRSSLSSQFFIAVLVVLLLVGGWFFWSLKMKSPSDTSISTTVTMPVSASENESAVTDASTLSSSATETVSAPVSNTAIQAQPITTRSTTPARAVAAGKLRIQLTFVQDSWTEISDGQGKRMMYDVGRVDLPRTIDVEPPIQVLLGNAAAVSMQVNGKPLKIPAQRIVNSVARFNIDADGMVR